MNQAGPQGSRHRAQPSDRSGAVAAVLSFVFPGLGQAYLGRRREALIFAVPVLLLFLGVAAWAVSSGLTRAGVKLLDPTFALIAALISALVVVWWALAVIGAWRAGRHSSQSTVLVPIALVAILFAATVVPVVPLGAGWLYSISVADRGLYSNVDAFTADASPLPTMLPGAIPTPQPTLVPGETATPEPTRPADYVDPGDEDPNDPPPTFIAGTPPPIDITKLDAQDDGWLNVLIIGIDQTVDRQILTGARSDTMIVVSTNPATNQVYMFSFPRDTARFPIYNGGTYNGKLNTFAGRTKGLDQYDGGGQQALANEIGFLLGIPIDYHAAINMDGFQTLVDAVGGVTVCNHHDLADDYMGYYLSPGLHELNGADALRYARSRHGMGGGDFARARRQQQLLSAIRSAIMQPENIANLPAIVTAMAGVISTDFPPDQIDQLVTLANQVQDDPTASYVFQFPTWAYHPPASDNNGRSQQFLKLDKIGALSASIFGDKSLYWTGQPVASGLLSQPDPSETPDPGATQC